MSPIRSNQEDSVVLSPEGFDAALVDVRPRLRAYVASLLGGWNAVDDIVQDVCVVLIQKRESFEFGTNFTAWAFRVAYFKATTCRRDMLREGKVMFSEIFFQSVAAMAEDHFTERPPIHDALSSCLEQLPTRDRELIHLKYADGVSLTRHAAASGLTAGALHKTISRIRMTLRLCIRRKLDAEPSSASPQ